MSTQVAIVTMTWARTSSEARMLENALRVLAKRGHPLFVGEGGSTPAFVRRLSRLPNVQICSRANRDKPSLVGQLGSAFQRAEQAQPKFVLYTEPDKRTFFEDGLERLLGLIQASKTRVPMVVLAARTPSGFATFPAGQRAAESMMNELCSEAFGQQGDYTYGPMLISGALLPYLGNMPDDLGWGWRFYLMAVARHLGAPIALCPVRGECPRAQRAEDDGHSRGYRLRQLLQNVTGLANGWITLLEEPGACAVRV